MAPSCPLPVTGEGGGRPCETGRRRWAGPVDSGRARRGLGAPRRPESRAPPFSAVLVGGVNGGPSTAHAASAGFDRSSGGPFRHGGAVPSGDLVTEVSGGFEGRHGAGRNLDRFPGPGRRTGRIPTAIA